MSASEICRFLRRRAFGIGIGGTAVGSREKILAALDALAPDSDSAPDRNGPWTRYQDKLAQFVSALEEAAVTVHRVADEKELDECLRSEIGSEVNRGADSGSGSYPSVVSVIDAVAVDDVGMNEATDPRSLAGVTHAVMPGVFGVAENGAIWMTPRTDGERGLMVLAEHLIVVVSVEAVVDHMADAYRRIGVDGVLGHDRQGYGVFLAGPSKTADIEQSLVIGAHGPRSMDVYLIG